MTDVRPPTSDLRPPTSERGVALIITVILLSLLTLMALAFLTMSQRERGAVTTTTDTASARLAADAALASAEAQIVANVLATTNPYNFGLLVSTNAWPLSFTTTSDLTNLYISPRAPVYLTNLVTQKLENRFYLDLNHNGVDDPNGWLPETNSLGQPTSATNFMVGDPEWIGVLQRPDQPYGPNNPFVARFAFIAVPIGNALDLNAIHNQAFTRTLTNSSDGFLRNQGVGSWEINLAAFLADLNTNQWDGTLGGTYEYLQPAHYNSGAAFADALSLLSYRYGFNYNNLATVDNLFGGPPNGAGYNAFRYDNIDGYSDGPLQTTFDTNADFVADDPSLPWAGADNTNHFFTHQELFDPTKTSIAFTNRLWSAGTFNATYDRYTFYRLLSQLGTDSAPEQNKININYSNAVAYFDANGIATSITIIPGAETNFTAWTPLQFFTIAADRMLRAYTTQWRNSNPTNFATTFYTVTNFNFVSSDQWTNYPAFGITNIPVLVSNRFVYSPAIQRVLQLAANIYDATTNNTAALGNNYPSVFKPIFRNDGTNVFVIGYEQQTALIQQANELLTPDLAMPVDVSSLLAYPPNTPIVGVNVYGVPWIIGAKKGFPNFNEFSMESAVRITRKLQVKRSSLYLPRTYTTNQMYILSITNYFGVECWNSYSTNYPRTGTGPIGIMLRDNMVMVLTNDAQGFLPVSTNAIYANYPIPYSVLVWPGYTNLFTNSFLVPLNTSVALFPAPPGTNSDSVYYYGPGSYSPPGSGLTFIAPCFIPQYLDPSNYLDAGTPPTPPLPHFVLLTTNRLQVAIIDYSAGINNGRIIDYVQLNGMGSPRDLNTEIADPDSYGQWSTNLNGNIPPYVPQGVINQILYSLNGGTLPSEDSDMGPNWSTASIPNFLYNDPVAQQDYFKAFFASNNTATYYDTHRTPPRFDIITNFELAVQAPYTPTRLVVQRLTWQANDPLVHYLASDLTDTIDDTNTQHTVNWTNWPAEFGRPNHRYMPWGGNPSYPGTDPNPYNPALKDPLTTNSDSWDFPTYKLPTIGWLGRVHRGTPWQTVFLKSPDILKEIQTDGVHTNYIGTNTWVQWTGDTLWTSGQYYDAANTAPAQDRLLFDLFTTAFNDNATRGTLSVNVGANDPNNPHPQAGLAAWSALFSGIVVPPTSPTNTYTVINPAGPAGANAKLGQIVADINRMRTNADNVAMILSISGTMTNEIPANFVNADGLVGSFEHVGDILATPALTEQSPFLNLANTDYNNDEMYEWLPQQVMSLLRVSGTPESPMRYVIYSYGQALKPAPNSLVTSGSFFGMVTNYQVVAEAATRAVVRFGSTLTNVVTLTTNAFNNPIWFAAPVVTNNNVVIERFNVLPPD